MIFELLKVFDLLELLSFPKIGREKSSKLRFFSGLLEKKKLVDLLYQLNYLFPCIGSALWLFCGEKCFLLSEKKNWV